MLWCNRTAVVNSRNCDKNLNFRLYVLKVQSRYSNKVFRLFAILKTVVCAFGIRIHWTLFGISAHFFETPDVWKAIVSAANECPIILLILKILKLLKYYTLVRIISYYVEHSFCKLWDFGLKGSCFVTRCGGIQNGGWFFFESYYV